LVVAFQNPVRVDTLHRRSVFLLVRRADRQADLDIGCDCEISMNVEPVVVKERKKLDVSWLIDEDPTPDNFELVTEVVPETGKIAGAVRLMPQKNISWNDLLKRLQEFKAIRLTVILRGDWILDEKNRGLDGDHIWPGVPEGQPTAAGVDGRASGNGSEGGDWISIIHFQTS
jgi:hypothetical protein